MSVREQYVSFVVLVEAAVVLVQTSNCQILSVVNRDSLHVKELIRLLVHLASLLNQLAKQVRIQERLVDGLVPLARSDYLDFHPSLLHSLKQGLLYLFYVLHIRLYDLDLVLGLLYDFQ